MGNDFEEQLKIVTPEFSDAIIAHCVNSDIKDEDGSKLEFKALPIGFLVEWLKIIKNKQAKSTAQQCVEILSKMDRFDYCNENGDDTAYLNRDEAISAIKKQFGE